MFSNNGESHRRLRGLVNKAFAAHSVESQRQGVREIVNDLGDQFEERGEMDAVADFAHWMPARTKCSISCTLLSLMRNPEQWRKLRANPSLAAAAAEESLRRDPALPWLMRVVTETFALDEVRFEPGELIVISPLGANHDPAKFPQSERFDIERNANDQLSFGLGPHFCIGSWIARMHLQKTLRMFATRFPDMHCVEDDIEWTPLFEFHRPQRLRVRTHH